MTEETPVECRRGFDQRWWEQQLSWAVVQVHAGCADVVRELLALRDIEGMVGDALEANTRVPPDEWSRTIFAYQLRGHDWTIIDSIHAGCLWYIGQDLSRALSTDVVTYMYEDIGGAGGYLLHRKGCEFEHYGFGMHVYDNPEDAKADYPPAKGWIHSDDNNLVFRSDRVSDVDLNAVDATLLPDRTARELGLYVPFGVWDVDSKTGEVKLQPAWSQQEFHQAMVLLANP
jgi:hypothetical protein